MFKTSVSMLAAHQGLLQEEFSYLSAIDVRNTIDNITKPNIERNATWFKALKKMFAVYIETCLNSSYDVVTTKITFTHRSPFRADAGNTGTGKIHATT